MAAGILLSMPGLVYGTNPAGTAAYDRAQWKKKYTRPAGPAVVANNAPSKERELLGRTLFFDPRFSGTQSMSCASCHNPGFSWGDGLAKGIGDGMKQLGRRTPTILNAAYSELQFWDGRAASLEEQALGPMKSPAEMNLKLDLAKVIEGIPGYRGMFAKAYPGEAIGEATTAKAIANFERTVVSGKAPFDHWIAGNEKAISEPAKRGFDVFNTKAACAKCHSSWNFSDSGFHDIGIPGTDRGRGSVLNLESMQYAFKTPTLRNATERAPYMHDGSEKTLEDVIELYDLGGREKRPSLAPEMVQLHLTAPEKSDLLAFLKTLSSKDRPIEIPVLPR